MPNDAVYLPFMSLHGLVMTLVVGHAGKVLLLSLRLVRFRVRVRDMVFVVGSHALQSPFLYLHSPERHFHINNDTNKKKFRHRIHQILFEKL